MSEFYNATDWAIQARVVCWRITVATLVLLVLVAGPVFAQRFPITNYTVDDGLPSNQLFEVLQDSRGLLWIASSGGLSRFDGTSFQTLGLRDGLSNETIRAVAEGPDGSLWLATGKTLAQYTGWEIREWGPEEGIRGGPLWDLEIDRAGRVWFATTSAGVGMFNGDTVRLVSAADGLATNQTYGLLIDSRNRLWVGPKESDKGLSVCEIDSVGAVSQCRVLSTADGFSSAPTRAFAEDGSGRIWIGTRGDGIYRYEEESFTHFPAEAVGLAGSDIYALWATDRNELAVGCLGAGISLCSLPNLENCRSIADGLSNNLVLGLYEDMEGALWISTLGGGLDMLPGEQFRHWGIDQGLPSPVVLSVYPDTGGDLWLGTMGGLTRLRNSSGSAGTAVSETWSVGQGIPHNEVQDILRDKHGRLWVGTPEGLCLFDETTGCRVFGDAEGLGHDYVSVLYESSQGDLWVGTLLGVSRVRLAKDAVDPEIKHFGPESGLAGSEVHAIAEDMDGRLWIGSLDGGLDVIDHDRILSYGLADGLPTDSLTALFFDKSGRLWIGTQGAGLVSVDPSQTPPQFRTHEGLGSHASRIRAIAEGTKEGTLWVASVGVDLFDPDADGGAGRVIRHFDRASGLLSTEVSSNDGLATDVNGTVWFGLNAGLTEYRPFLEPQVSARPAAAIVSVTGGAEHQYRPAFTLPVGQSDGELRLGQDPVRIAAGQRTVRFDYRGLTYSAPGATQYQIRLIGFDSEWSTPTTSVFKEYTNLAPGEYRFDVRVRGARDPWGEPASVAITVEPAYWQTPWFAVLVILMLFGLGLAAHWLRMRRIYARNRELEAAVRDRTKELRRHARALEKHVETLDRANELERRLEQARKIESLGIMFGGVAHDFNNLLTALLANIDQASKGISGNREAIDSLERAVATGQRAAQLSSQMLSFAEGTPFKRELLNLNELVAQYQSDIEKALGAGHEFVLAEDAVLPPCKVDPSAIRQALLNLVLNSREAMETSGETQGRVSVSFSVVTPDDPRPPGIALVELDTSQSYVAVIVADNGPGMDANTRRSAFDPFFTTKFLARGLGLPEVLGVLRAHGGSVNLDTGPQGTTMWLLFPVAPGSNL